MTPPDPARSPLGRALSSLAALLGLAAPACVDGVEAHDGRSAPAAPADAAATASRAAPRRPPMDRDRPPRVATATFALG